MPEATVNGVRLTYQTRGEGTPMLMVCGTGQTAASWELGGLIPAILETGCAVTTFDNRGILPSGCPEPPWTIGDMAEDTVALIEHLGIGPCHVLGASLGALVTQTVALRRPDLVRTATLMVGGGKLSRAVALSLEGSAALLRQGIELPVPLQLASLVDATLTLEQRQDDAAVEGILTLAASLTTAFGPGGNYGQTAANAAWAAEDHLSELADLAAPTLIIGAEHDTIFPPANLKRAAAMTPDATYVEMPGSAHVTTDPVAARVATDALRAFLEQHRS